jgi:hypothetical protein
LDVGATGSNLMIKVLPEPYAQPPLGAPVPFQIFRQPVRTADEPVTLPAGAIVDLSFSGMGIQNVAEFGVATPGNPTKQYLKDDPNAVTGWPSVPGVPQPVPKPVAIVFGPSGKLESVYYAHRPSPSGPPVFEKVETISPVYLLVGQPPNAGTTAPPNFMNTDNIWVTVNPQSGLVTTGEVANSPAAASGGAGLTYDDYKKAIAASRAFARSQQNMGGR